ncbi:MAG TPA: RNA 3'-terminal phosphate cyclase, partial [Agitococcus sp.]|nr:RNA 3'-terminal phosphate cyclase [Agitococcus sp.]
NSPATVDEYLADQLLLPMALAKGGSFTTNILSDHCVSNIHVIEKFLAVKFSCQSQSNNVLIECIYQDLAISPAII